MSIVRHVVCPGAQTHQIFSIARAAKLLVPLCNGLREKVGKLVVGVDLVDAQDAALGLSQCHAKLRVQA